MPRYTRMRVNKFKHTSQNHISYFVVVESDSFFFFFITILLLITSYTAYTYIISRGAYILCTSTIYYVEEYVLYIIMRLIKVRV